MNADYPMAGDVLEVGANAIGRFAMTISIANPVTGLLIARGDTVLYKHYRYVRKNLDRFMSQSMAKTMIGMLIGIAISEGTIHSIVIIVDPSSKLVLVQTAVWTSDHDPGMREIYALWYALVAQYGEPWP